MTDYCLNIDLMDKKMRKIAKKYDTESDEGAKSDGWLKGNEISLFMNEVGEDKVKELQLEHDNKIFEKGKKAQITKTNSGNDFPCINSFKLQFIDDIRIYLSPEKYQYSAKDNINNNDNKYEVSTCGSFWSSNTSGIFSKTKTGTFVGDGSSKNENNEENKFKLVVSNYESGPLRKTLATTWNPFKKTTTQNNNVKNNTMAGLIAFKSENNDYVIIDKNDNGIIENGEIYLKEDTRIPIIARQFINFAFNLVDNNKKYKTNTKAEIKMA